jgi:hypothetical protein
MKARAKALALAATVALAWVAGADAAYQTPQNAAGSTLLFSAWDPTSGASYTRDLGQTFSSFTTSTAPTIPIDLTADTNYNTFANFVSANGGSLQWNVVSARVTTSGTYGLDTTSSVDLSPGDVQNVSTGNAALNLGKFMNVLNANCSFSVTGSCVSLNASNTWNINNSSANWDAFLGNVFPTDTTTGLGGSLKFYGLTASSISGATNSTIALMGTGLAPQVFALSNTGELTWNVGAVPEPSSWAMLAAGLAVIGVIARRRVGQQ